MPFSVCLADSPIRAAIDENSRAKRYIADLQLHSAAELDKILRRADDLYQRQSLATNEPVVFVLHGAEARVFLRSRYAEHKDLVDRAARLTAFGVVDIRVCERWMGGQGIVAEQLVPFVSTVEFGPAEINRLRQTQNYVDF